MGEGSTDPMNLGLMAIASTLKEKGYQVILIPNIDFPGSKRKLKKEMKNALMVGVSCMTGDPILNGLKFSKTVRQINPRIPICWGGYHATIDYLNTIKNEYVDFVIRGQGEKTIVELVEALKNRKFDNIDGLVYKKNGKIMINNPRKIESLDSFPFLDYEIFMDCYKVKKVGLLIYCSSRGCPFECTFCSVSNFYEKRYLSYSLDRFLSDIAKIVKQYNPEHIYFWDDNFFVSEDRVRGFMNDYLKNGYKFEWSAFSRCEVFSIEKKDFLKDLVKCNCKRILFGAESGSPRILRYIKKHIRVRDILNSCRILTKYEITPDYTFISGFPTEKITDLSKTMKVIDGLHRLNPDAGVRLFSFCPSPGIPILKDCIKEGFKIPENIEDWSRYEYHSFVAPWVTKKHQNRIKKLVWITSFISSRTMPNSGRWWLETIYQILHWDAAFRLRLNFFALAPEWIFLFKTYKKHYLGG